MKKIIFISVTILSLLIFPNVFAENSAENSIDEEITNEENNEHLISQNYMSTPYTPSVVYDSGFIPWGPNQNKRIPHNLNNLPVKIDILFKDSVGRITGWDTGFKTGDGSWRGIKWGQSYCDSIECNIYISGALGSSSYGGFNSIRILLWQ